jgi:hypothetical protein
MKQIILLLVTFCLFAVNADFEWMYLRKYGSDVTLKPLKPRDQPDFVYNINRADCYWLKPSGEKLIPSIVNLNTDHYSIATDTCELTIFNIQAADNGIYHVYLNATYVTKAMLNYHGPPYESFLDEYGINFLAAFSTAGGILFLV